MGVHRSHVGGAGVNVGRDADCAPTGFEQYQGTAHVNDRVENSESSAGVGLGNRLDRVEVAIQNLTRCMANLVESKQAAQGRDPSRGQVNDCQSSRYGGLTLSLGVPSCVGLGETSHGGTRSLYILVDSAAGFGRGAGGIPQHC